MVVDLFRQVIRDFQSQERPKLTHRSLSVPLIRDMSTSIVGARRVGKTYRTYQFISELVASGTPIENVCRVQFNDNRFCGMSSKELDAIEGAYYSLFPEKLGKESVYFVFDEIHQVEGWENFVLRLLDKPHQKVIITGSTSKLLTGEISSSLRGKNFPVVQYPFSFSEFLTHYGIKPDFDTTQGVADLRKSFLRYLDQGGFPGMLDLPQAHHVDMLQSYWDTMVLRDIIEAHPNNDIAYPAFSRFAKSLAGGIGKPFTVRGMAAVLRESGVRFSNETIYRYLSFMREAFMAFALPIYSDSVKVQQRNYSKSYFIDWALAEAVAPAGGIDKSRKLENLVFIELMRRKFELGYFLTREGWEIDFVGTRKGEKPLPIQVTWTLSDPLRGDAVAAREMRGIAGVAEYLRTDRALILTFDDPEREIKLSGVTVQIIPIWKWCLSAEG